MIVVSGFQETNVPGRLLLSFPNMEEDVARVIVSLTRGDGGLVQAALVPRGKTKGVLVEGLEWSSLHLLVIDADGDVLGVGTYTQGEDGRWLEKHVKEMVLFLKHVDHEAFVNMSQPQVLESLQAPYFALELEVDEEDPTGHFYLAHEHVNDVLVECLNVTGYDCS